MKMDMFAAQERQAIVDIQIVNKRNDSEGKRESQSEWEKVAEWLEVSMNREEKEMLGQQKREENVEAKLWVQSHPVCAREQIWKSKVKKINNTEQASFISTLFLFSLVNWKKTFFKRNHLFLFNARRYDTCLWKLLQLKMKEYHISYLLLDSNIINTPSKLVGHTISYRWCWK